MVPNGVNVSSLLQASGTQRVIWGTVWDAGLSSPIAINSGVRDTANFPINPATGYADYAKAYGLWANHLGWYQSSGSYGGGNYEGMYLLGGSWGCGSPNPLHKDIIDGISSVVSAYSVARRISYSYSGPLIRVRRSIDNTSQDISGDSNNNLDTSALLSFASTGSAFVSMVYDQTGRGQHLTMFSNSCQPRIVGSGTLETDGNDPLGNEMSPVCKFDGVDDMLSTSGFTINSPMSVFLSIRPQLSGITTASNVIWGGYASPDLIIRHGGYNNSIEIYGGIWADVERFESNAASVYPRQYTFMTRSGAGVNRFRINGVEQSLPTYSTSNCLNPGGYTIGNATGYIRYTPMWFREMVVCSGQPSQDIVDTIERKMMSRYVYAHQEMMDNSLMMSYADLVGTGYYRCHSPFYASGIILNRELYLANAIKNYCDSHSPPLCYPAYREDDNEDFYTPTATVSYWVSGFLSDSRIHTQALAGSGLTYAQWASGEGVPNLVSNYSKLIQLLFECTTRAISTGIKAKWQSVMPESKYGNFQLVSANSGYPLKVSNVNYYNKSFILDYQSLPIYYVDLAAYASGSETESQTWRKMAELNISTCRNSSPSIPIIPWILWPETPLSFPHDSNYYIPDQSDIQWLIETGSSQYGITEYIAWTWNSGDITGFTPDPTLLSGAITNAMNTLNNLPAGVAPSFGRLSILDCIHMLRTLYWGGTQ